MNRRIHLFVIPAVLLYGMALAEMAREQSPSIEGFRAETINPASCLPHTAGDACLPQEAFSQIGDSVISDPENGRATFANEEWSTVETSTPPPPRFRTDAIHIPHNNSMVIFGGRNNAIHYFDDAWALDLETYEWTEQGTQGTISPQGRDRFSIVYDSDRDRMVLYGGYIGGSYANDVWALDFATQSWTPLSTSGVEPHYRNGHCSVYDQTGNRMIVYGGYYYDDGWLRLADLWALDLDSLQWTELQPTGQPLPTQVFQCIYDAENQSLYVYGGYDDNHEYYPAQLSVLDVQSLTWNVVTVTGTNPGPKISFSLVYDDANSRLILQGGHYYNGSYAYYYRDIWALDMESWSWNLILPTGELPEVLHTHTAIYDGGARMYSWGGRAYYSSWTSNTTYLLEWSPADADGDTIPDDEDLCPDTTIPESVPTNRLGVNRWALVDDDELFDTTPPHGGGGGPDFEFSIQDTGGCSCEQIIENRELGWGHTKFGCSTGVMLQWVSEVADHDGTQPDLPTNQCTAAATRSLGMPSAFSSETPSGPQIRRQQSFARDRTLQRESDK